MPWIVCLTGSVLDYKSYIGNRCFVLEEVQQGGLFGFLTRPDGTNLAGVLILLFWGELLYKLHFIFELSVKSVKIKDPSKMANISLIFPKPIQTCIIIWELLPPPTHSSYYSQTTISSVSFSPSKSF
jgi:hypothetical protein